eukprot:3358862-Rhodomonas_salina.1
MVFVFFIRVAINRFIHFLIKRKHKDDPPPYEPTIAFMSWELQVSTQPLPVGGMSLSALSSKRKYPRLKRADAFDSPAPSTGSVTLSSAIHQFGVLSQVFLTMFQGLAESAGEVGSLYLSSLSSPLVSSRLISSRRLSILFSNFLSSPQISDCLLLRATPLSSLSLLAFLPALLSHRAAAFPPQAISSKCL